MNDFRIKFWSDLVWWRTGESLWSKWRWLQKSMKRPIQTSTSIPTRSQRFSFPGNCAGLLLQWCTPCCRRSASGKALAYLAEKRRWYVKSWTATPMDSHSAVQSRFRSYRGTIDWTAVSSEWAQEHQSWTAATRSWWTPQQSCKKSLVSRIGIFWHHLNCCVHRLTINSFWHFPVFL